MVELKEYEGSMNCKRCMEISEFEITEADVYISVPTHIHDSGFQKAIKEMSLEARRLSNAYVVRTPNFKTLVIKLAETFFSQMEQKDLMMLPLSPGEPLQFEALQRYKSLMQWKAWFQGSALLEIIRNRWLKIEFQPIVEVATGQIYAYEALSRGIQTDGEIIPPADLFQMARNMDLIFYLDRLCRETIIAQTFKKGITKKVFINFNPNAIYDPEKCLRSTIAEIHKYALREDQFVFEVIESEHVGDYGHLKTILDFYRNKGYEVALDDLGCGYNTLGTLEALYPNYLKIAREVIQNIHQNRINQERLRQYILAAKEKGIKVIAEGVEQEEEFFYVTQMGVDFVQGFYLARPAEIPVQEVLRY